ncbi:hypothetical protein [Rufibacter tibetensis]|uniref:Uncharacterized protein n=1 Tax=Rufibacter tibetensis TaxID=512763 RepID=A0A0P0D471_9BACT|nr:hypothetical protein [Rufibacter tibetensis]ALJ01715.1 hypothetical protein DC20_21960 [Rufibacter tibetensis]
MSKNQKPPMENGTQNPEGKERQVLFSERQRFRQTWLWVLLLGVNVSLVWRAYEQIYVGHLPNGGQLLGAGVGILGSALVFCCRLETTIREDGIYVRLLSGKTGERI